MMPMVWLFVLVAAGIIEAVTVDMVSIWFCAGAAAALIASWNGVAFWPQIAIFTAVSLACILITKPLTKKMLRGNIVPTNLDRLIGKTAVITKAIASNERGEARVNGETWLAISHDGKDIAADTKVEILSIEGTKLVVRPL